MTRTTVALILGAVLAAPLAAQQSRWDAQVDDQMNRAGQVLAEKGFSKDQSIRSGSLREGESEVVTLELRAGKTYALIGVCDNDCGDLDLHLYDASDNEIGSDTQTHDAPLVHVTPRETGTYRLKLVMTACKTSPCFYGVGVFDRTAE